jgi:superfamily II DNA or RNA helicase
VPPAADQLAPPDRKVLPMLSNAERLHLQQLRLRAWVEARSERTNDQEDPTSAGEPMQTAPASWSLTGGIELHPWQVKARAQWFNHGRKGTIKVVTGAGKTLLALAIAEQLQREDPKLRMAVVVPTIVLMNQWYDTVLEHSNLPPTCLGRLGGGHTDDFQAGRLILISVLASARKELPRLVREAGVGESLLFVADECHRVGAPEMSAVLRTTRAYSLGLSATPERDDADRDDDTVDLSEELGQVVYEMSFAQAISEGVLPPFEIHHYGLPLQSAEARRYNTLSRSITDARRELLAASPTARKSGGGERLLAWARRASSRPGQFSGVAARYVQDTTRRKQLLYRAKSRKTATVELIEDTLNRRPDARVILFHESIEEVTSLFEELASRGIPAVMEHSELPAELRERTLELFRDGTAKVVVSARSLIEGFNVPEADLGIVVASSSSPRQRIQSIGRVLRRYTDDSGEQKSSRVCVLYIRDTVDEAIYERENWDKLIGLERNRYFTWDPPRAPDEQNGPPKASLPPERDIDLAHLTAGDRWPGRYEGQDFSTDTQGNVIDPDGRVAMNPQQVPAWINALVGRAGRFKLTPGNNAVLVRTKRGEDAWETLFAGTLSERFDFDSQPELADQVVDASRLDPGGMYPGPLEPAQELRFRQRRGGVLARRIRGGEAYAQGPDAKQAVATIKQLTRSHGPINKVFLNDQGHLFWRDAGTPRFIMSVGSGFQFPEVRP